MQVHADPAGRSTDPLNDATTADKCLMCAGNLGTNSADLIRYYQGFKGVAPIKEGINPATWMLQVSSPLLWLLSAALAVSQA